MNIYINNIKRIFTNKAKLIVIFIVPMLFTILFMSDDFNTEVSMAVVDEDQSRLSQELIKKLDSENKIVLLDEKEVKDQLIVGKVDYALTIPKGFENDILGSKEVSLEEIFFIEGMKLHGTRTYIMDYIQNIQYIARQETNPDDFFKRLTDLNDQRYLLVKEVVDGKSAAQTESGIGFMIQFILYMSIVTTAFLIVDKDRNTIIRIITSKVSRGQYLFESFLSFITIGLIQVVILFTFYHFYFQLNFGKHPLLLMLIMMLFTVVATTMSMLIVILLKNEMVAYGVVIVITTPLVMLGGCYFDIDTMAPIIQTIARFLPTFWAMDGALTLLRDGDTQNLGSNFAVLLTFAATFLIMSIIGYKKFAKV